MEPYLTVVLAFLGGGTMSVVIGYFINRRKSGVEVRGLKDDQTAKWRDNALHLSDEIIEKDREINAALKSANDLTLERDTLSHKLSICLKKIDDCDCL